MATRIVYDPGQAPRKPTSTERWKEKREAKGYLTERERQALQDPDDIIDAWEHGDFDGMRFGRYRGNYP
jgi:hypothetical protein